MTIRLIVFLLILQWSYPAFCEQEFKYNPVTDQWSYEEKGSTLQYNPASGAWEYAPPEADLTYNPFEDKWKIEDDEAGRYNPFFQKKELPILEKDLGVLLSEPSSEKDDGFEFFRSGSTEAE